MTAQPPCTYCGACPTWYDVPCCAAGALAAENDRLTRERDEARAQVARLVAGIQEIVKPGSPLAETWAGALFVLLGSYDLPEQSEGGAS